MKGGCIFNSKVMSLCVSFLFAVVCIFSPTALHASQKKLLLTFGTTSSSSGYYATLVAYAKLINKYVKGVNITPIETGATIDNWKRMSRGEIQIAFGATGSNWQAYYGKGKFEGAPVKDGRLLWVFAPTGFHFIVRADSGVNDIYELEGKRFDIGIPGSTTAETAQFALRKWGITPKTEMRSTADAIEAIKDGRIVGFVKGCTDPDAAVLSLLATTKLRFLNVTDSMFGKLKQERPFLIKVKVPAGTYPGQDYEFSSYGFTVSVVCIGSAIPADIQYKIVKAIYEHYDEFLQGQPRYKLYDPLRLTVETGIIPLAPGTVKYLREKGYKIQPGSIPPEMK
ncbi:MAG: hypothetical protein DRG71_01700 [Deltaproteobacteria bacterium]|nr:MAG: hypothetical protein DRG71_01700 [Deltaproteobacteria bacterium]